ncbi:MAG: cellulase family glycosylhydrolase [Leeuwenhoekiella sp.]
MINRIFYFLFVKCIIIYGQNYHYAIEDTQGYNTSGIYRGYTAVSQETDSQDIANMKKDGANIVRWMLYRTWTNLDRQDIDIYDEWLEGQLVVLDSVMIVAEAKNVQVIIDLHTPPGEFYSDGSQRLFYETKFTNEYVKVWKKIANRYKKCSALYAYELLNEPVQTYNAEILKYDPIEAQCMAAREIRKIDSETTLILASKAWNAPTPFFSVPITELDNIIYSVHLYQLMEFTHQGIAGFGQVKYAYPGPINGWTYYGKEQIKQVLKTVRDFQLKHNVKIYVGEFSVVRWAQGGDAWLEDAVAIFEEYNWDWTYHAYCNVESNPYAANIWSLEFENGEWGKYEGKLSENPSSRKKVILREFEKNAY